MKIFLNDRHPLSPLGELKATLSKIQFVIFVPTLVRFAVSIAACTNTYKSTDCRDVIRIL